MKDKSTPILDPLPGKNYTWLGLLFYRLQERRKASIKKTMEDMYTGFIRTTDSLDFRKCLHVLKKFSGLDNERLAERCKVSLNMFGTMESRNKCNRADMLETLSLVSAEYYLDDISKWFDTKKLEIWYKQRPTRTKGNEAQG